MDMSFTGAAFEGGFSDPVHDAQAVFRAVMEAMANPGRIADLGEPTNAPAPLGAAASAVLAALADYDTPVWFEAEETAAAAEWLAFHTGAPVAPAPEQAVFAVLSPGSAVEAWSRFAIGTSSYPDRSATLILPVDGFGSGPELAPRGPGIETVASIRPSGLPEGFVAAMGRNGALFPLGLDLLLVCGSEVVALPRTTRITEA